MRTEAQPKDHPYYCGQAGRATALYLILRDHAKDVWSKWEARRMYKEHTPECYGYNDKRFDRDWTLLRKKGLIRRVGVGLYYLTNSYEIELDRARSMEEPYEIDLGNMPR